MRRPRPWAMLTMMALALAAGCADADADDAAPSHDAVHREAPAPPPPAPFTAADSVAALARIAARADSARAAFAAATELTAREVATLRQDVNAEQLASARRLGLRVSGAAEVRRLERAGRLVALGDSTEFWILRDMDHSTPSVTPETRAMLEELGRRFHARLDSLGLPRYRMKVTSALRTAADQEALRRVNSYATTQTSAHQFATTVDVSHERFAAPAPAPPGDVAPEDAAWLAAAEADTLAAVEEGEHRKLQAALGRAILQMRAEGRLHVMMENLQPVYHMTRAR